MASSVNTNQNQLTVEKEVAHYRDIWQHVCSDLNKHYGESLYKSWFSKINFLEASTTTVILSTPTNFIRDWIKSRYARDILQSWQSYDKDIKSIEIVTKELLEQNPNIPEYLAKIPSIKEGMDINSEGIFSALDLRFTFENFVVGGPNELAYEASRAVAESESAVAESNPLFLYGGVGLGKTHLMHAIAWYIRHNNPTRKVIYMSAEKFMYQFIKALRNKDVMSFKEEFRSVDVLMIDDIQFISGKDSTQEEFFHTFNALIDNNRQMVISCDRSPSDLDNIEERIKSRLGWGLVADVHSTTYELRLGILESKLEQMNIHIPKNVVEFLASKITSNVRELEGALNKVIAHSTLVGREITLENTQNILRDLLRSNERIITIEDIQRKVADRYNIKFSDMSSPRRIRSIARPRQVAMYLSKTLTPKSLTDIGKKFGKKDHTTIMHAIKKVEELCEIDAEFREELSLLMKILQN
ncbi:MULTISPECIES: chromosomal replication initiator protein DnaA [unclassified Candidatus Tisiphia]|uniref:chromosomal replication initiator protein DnaA n=1 Tax=unclassified Candidatus Tisiphia TaxID=2996318 RepID=UPI0035C906DD